MMQAIFHILLVTMALVSTIAMFSALPIKKAKSARQRRVERNLPAVIVIFALVAFGALLYGFASDASARYVVSYADLQKRLHQNGGLQPSSTKAPRVEFSPFRELASTFSFAKPASGIDCSQIQLIGPSTYSIKGPVYVGGASISNSTVSRGAVRIGEYDLASLIGEKCAGSLQFEDALRALP